MTTARSSPTLALARFEARMALRNVRTWVLGILATLLGLVAATYYLLIYRLASGLSGPFAYITHDVWVFLSAWGLGQTLGLVGIFHAFDWRHRDEAARFAATLDAAPLSRLQLCWGKFLGIALVLLAPYSVLWLGQALGVAIARVPVAPSSFIVGAVYGFTVALVPTAVAFAVASLVRSRAAAIVAGLLFLAATFATVFALPEELAVLAGSSADMTLHSDFTGYVGTGLEAVQRGSAVLQVLLFVTLAAFGRLALPSSAAARGRTIAAAGALGVAVAASLAATWWLYSLGTTEREAVVAAERAVADRATATVTRRALDVTLAGRKLEGVARLGLRNDGVDPLEELVLRLNAGLQVLRVEGPDGPLEHRRDRTVVLVPLRSPLGPGAETSVEVGYAGELDLPSVDAELALANRAQSAQLRNNQRLFGMTAAYLQKGVAALGVDAGWYPEPGVLAGHDYPARARQSFAPGTLVVRVPEGWTPASAGRRSREDGGAWRFESEVPVSGVSLNAARYEEREMQAAGVTVRLLFHPKHGRNVELLAEAAPLLKQHVETVLADLQARTGLSYPHPELTVVEVPQSFAAFGPGWDTPNRMGAPGVVMLRESALRPHFGLALKIAKERMGSSGGSGGDDALAQLGIGEDDTGAARPPAAEVMDVSDVSPAHVKLAVVKRFFRSDWAGGDLESLAFKSAWHHRAQAVGSAAPLLGPALASFQNERALGRIHLETPQSSAILAGGGNKAGGVVMAPLMRREVDMGRVLLEGLTDLDKTYEIIQSTPVDQLDPRALGVEFLGVLDLKGRRPLQAMAALLGDDGWNRAMGRLLEAPGGRYDWGTFRAAVIAEAPSETADALAILLDNWVSGTALPGFVVDRAVAHRLERDGERRQVVGGVASRGEAPGTAAREDDPERSEVVSGVEDSVAAPRTTRLEGDGERWQVVLGVENRGDAPGIARLEVASGDDVRSTLVTLRAGERAEAGIVVPRKPDRWTLRPFLALNRAAPKGALEVRDQAVAAEPFEGVRPALAPPDSRIVFDNLDEGFSVTVHGGEEASVGGAPASAKSEIKEWVGFRPPSRWSRWRSRAGWHVPYGRFDSTAVVKKGSKGDQPARWRITLPKSGTYRLEAYLPRFKEKAFPRLPKSYSFVVRDASGEAKTLVVDLPPTAGWTDLGRFELGTETTIELRDEGEGLIVADAIRVVPESA